MGKEQCSNVLLMSYKNVLLMSYKTGFNLNSLLDGQLHLWYNRLMTVGSATVSTKQYSFSGMVSRTTKRVLCPR